MENHITNILSPLITRLAKILIPHFIALSGQISANVITGLVIAGIPGYSIERSVCVNFYQNQRVSYPFTKLAQ